MSVTQVGIRIVLEGAPQATGQIKQVEAQLDSLGESTARVTASSTDATRASRTVGDAFERVGRSAGSGADGSEKLASALKTIGRYGAGGAALFAVVDTLGRATRALFDASSAAERLRLQLEFATGRGSAQEMAFVSDVARRLGLEFDSAAGAYARLASAARGTALAGQGARDVFQAVANAAAVMGLSTSETEGVLQALQQMISKGTVQAEELRGQLGERLPGAFQIAARAMGVSTEELGKLLEQGRVVAEDFLPRFATQLERELGGSADRAADRLEASVNRMGNAWTRLKTAVGDAGVSTAVSSLSEMVTYEMTAVSDAMESARQRGGNSLMQLSNGIGMLIARTLGLQLLSAEFSTLESRMAAAGARVSRLTATAAERNLGLSERAELAIAQADLARATRERQIAAGDDGVAASDMRFSRAGAERLRGEQALRQIREARDKFMQSYRSDGDRLADAIRQYDEQFKGRVAADQYAQDVAAIRAKFAGSGRGGPSIGEQDAAELAKLAGLSSSFAKEWEQLSSMYARGKLSVEQLTQAQAALLAQQPAIRDNAKAIADEIRAQADQEKRLAEEREKIAAHVEKQRLSGEMAQVDALKALDEQVVSQRLASQEIGLTSEALAALRLRRQEDALAVLEQTYANKEKQGADFRELENLRLQIDRTRELIELRRDGAAREAEVESAKAVADEWKRTSQQIEQSLTDSLFRAAEAGKGFFETLRDAVKGMFSNLVLRPIIQATIGGIGAGGSGAALAGGSGGSGGGDMMSTLSSVAGLTGVSSAFGGGIAAGITNSLFGSGIGGSMTAASSLIGTGAAGTAAGVGSAVGAVAPYVLAAYAAYRLVASLRKKRTTAEGIDGTLGGDVGFEGQGFREWKRRWGGSGRDEWALAPEMTAQLADSVSSIQTATRGYAEALGLPVAALQTYTQALRLDTRGLGEQEIRKKLEEALGAFADGLAGTLGDAVSRFAREGERAADTLARLATSLSSVNDVLTTLGQPMMDIGTAGADAASQLADLFGGIDNLRQSAAGYLAAFYSDDERARLSIRAMTETLAAVGAYLPETREQFRALVESQDLTTAAGRRLYATLLQIRPAFDQVETYQEQAAQAAIDAAKESARAWSESVQAVLDAEQKIRDAWTGVTASIIDEIKRIRGDMEGSTTTNAAAQFATLTAQARAGDRAAAEALPAAARAMINAARETSSTAADFAVIQGSIAASLEQTATITGRLADVAYTGGSDRQAKILDSIIREVSPAVTSWLDTLDVAGLPSSMPSPIATKAADAYAAPVVSKPSPLVYETAAVVPRTSTEYSAPAAPTSDAVERALREEMSALREEIRAGLAAVASNTATTAKRMDEALDVGMPTYAAS